MCQNLNQNRENTENPVKYRMSSNSWYYCKARRSAGLIKLLLGFKLRQQGKGFGSVHEPWRYLYRRNSV